MERDDLRAFARRDWAAIELGKQRYWADRYHRDGGGPARQAATLLLDHARRLGVSGLTEAERDEDLAHHIQVRDRLDRAARALPRR